MKVEEGEPELLSYRRFWTLPSNVIVPATGLPTGSAYWRLDEKTEKPKLFKEPGFIIGFHAVRPKMFDGKQVYSRAASMWGFRDFIPSYTLSDNFGRTAWNPMMKPGSLKSLGFSVFSSNRQ